MSSRPRRSVVPTSYQLVIPKLPGDSDEESQEPGEDAEDGAGPGDGTNVEGAAAIGANDEDGDDDDDEDDDSASGSEYAPDVAKGKDGESKPESDADSAEMEFEANGTISNPEDDDEDSAAGEAELDDRISIADSENLLPHERELSPGAPGRSQGLKHGRVSFVGDASRFDSPAGSSSAAPIRVLGRTPFAVIGNVHPNNKKTNPRRKLGTSAGTSKRTPLYDLSFGQSHYPSPRFLLAKDFDDQCHCPRNGAQAGAARENGLQITEALTDKQRLFLVKRTAYLPFGPEYTACEDIGWYKGKTIQQVDPETGNTVSLRSTRWGGWYDTVHTQLNDFDVISDIGHVLPYLPHNLYPAKPAPIHLVCVSKSEKEEENEDEPWDMTGLPTVPPFTDGNASMPADNDMGEFTFTMPDIINGQPNGHSRAGSTLDEDDGVFRLRMGLIGDVESTNDVQDASLAHQAMVEIERFTSHRLDAHMPNKPGYILNAGGPVFGLDWCPQADDATPAAREYLAVSTVSDHTAVSYDTSVITPRQGLVQIWSLDTSVRTDMADATTGLKGQGMNLELAILLDIEAIQITWCPRGGQVEDYQGGSDGTDSNMGSTSASIPRLGLLAVLDTRGRLTIYGVPVPSNYRKAAGISNNDLVFLKPKSPLLRLDLGTMPICSFEWANHDMLAVGTTDGHVAIFHVEAALTSGAPSVDATYILPVHETPVTMLSIIREPSMSSDGVSCIDADPTRIATSALDGSSKVVDLQDWGTVIDFGHERAIRVVTRYQPAVGGIVYCDQELGNRYIALRLRDFGASTRIVSHNGVVLDLASSDNHPFMASASADGSCALSNPLRRLKRSSHSAHYLTKVYRMDFNRRSGEYRMLDNMLPDSRINHESRILRRMKSNKKAAKKKKKPKPKKAKGKGKARDQDGVDQSNGADANGEGQEEAVDEEEEEEEEDEDEDDEYADPDTLASVSWPPEVAVNRVAWHRSLRRAHVLASGMACGLVRVDIVSKPWTLELPPRFVDPSSILQAPDEDDDD